MLLHLIDGQPAADCVERPWTVVDEIVGMRRAPVDHVDDAAVERGGVEFFAAALAIQADAEFGARLRIENQPALFLAAREARAARGLVVGKIGRASGRERVCQSEYSSVVAVS